MSKIKIETELGLSNIEVSGINLRDIFERIDTDVTYVFRELKMYRHNPDYPLKEAVVNIESHLQNIQNLLQKLR